MTLHTHGGIFPICRCAFRLERKVGAISRGPEQRNMQLEYPVGTIWRLAFWAGSAMEFLLAVAVLLNRYPPIFTLIAFGSDAAHVAFTLVSTN